MTTARRNRIIKMADKISAEIAAEVVSRKTTGSQKENLMKCWNESTKFSAYLKSKLRSTPAIKKKKRRK